MTKGSPQSQMKMRIGRNEQVRYMEDGRPDCHPS